MIQRGSVVIVVLVAIGMAWLASCADMDQCSLGLCAQPCPAVMTGASSSTTGGGGAAAVCNPRGTVTTGDE